MAENIKQRTLRLYKEKKEKEKEKKGVLTLDTAEHTNVISRIKTGL